MGGNRPKNHISAKYVVVIDRKQGCIYYYALDKSGVLIYENGQPKLEYVLPYIVQEETDAQNSNNEKSTEDTENVGNIENAEDAEDLNDNEMVLEAPIVQENEVNSDDSDVGDPSDFQFYDEYNYENPFGFEDSWESFYFEF